MCCIGYQFKQRIEYKLCDLLCKAIHHIAPVYDLTEICVAESTPKVALIFAQQHMDT